MQAADKRIELQVDIPSPKDLSVETEVPVETKIPLVPVFPRVTPAQFRQTGYVQRDPAEFAGGQGASPAPAALAEKMASGPPRLRKA